MVKLTKTIAAFAFLGALMGASSALAYIPPSQFIIKNMTSKRTGVRVVRVSSVVIAPGVSGAKAASRHFKVVTVYDAAKRSMRSEAFDGNGTVLYVTTKSDAQLPLSLQVLYDPYYADIVGALRRSSIPVQSTRENTDDIVSLQRWNGSIAWALGLAAGSASQKSAVSNSDSSQLWIEKDSFLPVRLIVGDQDIQFTNYRYSQELPYPRTTTLASRAGVEQLEEDIQSFQMNPSAAAMKVWAKLDDAGTAAATGLTSAGDASPLKDLIRAYYAGIR